MVCWKLIIGETSTTTFCLFTRTDNGVGTSTQANLEALQSLHIEDHTLGLIVSVEVCVCRAYIHMHSAPKVRIKLLHSTLMSRPKDHLCVKFLIAVKYGSRISCKC